MSAGPSTWPNPSGDAGRRALSDRLPVVVVILLLLLSPLIYDLATR
ncbi:MAG TPA: hypothetical protein VFC93_20110 [Chloroflexota bacterium]|jgi:hypothetical protein|nr:hypothetical protein [Chloroflexota bacterium]